MKYDRILLARNHFWAYCRVREPVFYREERKHLFELCNTLNLFYRRKLIAPNGKPCKKLMINIPPQHGKSRTLINFCQWILGRNSKERIILGSYNDTTAQDFSKYTRDGIQEINNDASYLTFYDIFEKKIRRGSAAYHKWALEGEHFNYIGTGIGGSVTSKGGTVLIIDDPVKGAIEALSDNYLERCWTWYTSTFLSRVSAEAGEALQILCMTRWSTKDICGRVLQEDHDEWFQFKRPAYDEETGEMLCKDFLNYERYLDLKKYMIPEIFDANYHQEPVEIKGTLYKLFKTYKTVPVDSLGNSLFRGIFNYTDTADEGDSYLCSICYGILENYVYILDVYFTKDGMEITEPETASFLIRNKVNVAKIESNNGGRGFARNVRELVKQRNVRVHITWFHQSKNKMARILSESAFVQNNILFPEKWANMWPEFFKHLRTFKKEGKNRITDGADAITGVAENHRGVEQLPNIRVSKPR